MLSDWHKKGDVMRKTAVFMILLLLLLVPIASADPFTDWFRGLFGITGKVTSEKPIILHRTVRDCATGNAIGAEQVIDLRTFREGTYTSYTCVSRYRQQCIDDGSFDSYYDEWCEYETVSTTPPPSLAASPYCGDNLCNGVESCSTCSSDCGACPVITPTCTPSCNTCSGFSDVCDTTGTQSCTGTDCSNYTQSCTRSTEGVACNGGKCSNGQCVNITSPVITPVNPCDGVVCNDYCSGYIRYYNGACINGGCNYTIQENSSSCGWQQPSNVNINNISCTDTDSGKNYYVKGTTSNSKETQIDQCSSNVRLLERYCDSDGNVIGYYIDCSMGYTCQDGACIIKTSFNETNVTLPTTNETNVTSPPTPINGTCGTSLNGVCPATCSAGSDADCCKNSGKFWLKTSLGYGCYSSNYNPGCYGNEACGSQTDGCCPNWCAAGSDADCCINLGKNWVKNSLGYYNCVDKVTQQTATTQQISSVQATQQLNTAKAENNAVQTEKTKEESSSILAGVMKTGTDYSLGMGQSQSFRIWYNTYTTISYPTIKSETTYSPAIENFAKENGVAASTAWSIGRHTDGCSDCQGPISNPSDACKKCREGMLTGINKQKEYDKTHK